METPKYQDVPVVPTIEMLEAARLEAAQKYKKPSSGIPKSDMHSDVQTSLGKADTAYQKPSGGIPKTDLTSGVQGSLDKADAAIPAPSTAGTAGQVLQLDANGEPEWVTPTAGTTPDPAMSDSSTNAVQNKVIKEYVADEQAEVARGIYELNDKDADTKYGQPRLLFGNHTPQEATVPDNWVQLADGGYNWIGKPAFVGQLYINTAVSSGGLYIGYKKSDNTLDWRTIIA